MLRRSLRGAVPARWLTGDEVYGNDPGLRAESEAQRIGYVLAIGCDRRVATPAGPIHADQLAADLPHPTAADRTGEPDRDAVGSKTPCRSASAAPPASRPRCPGVPSAPCAIDPTDVTLPAAAAVAAAASWVAATGTVGVIIVAVGGLAMGSGIYIASRRSAITAANVNDVPRPPVVDIAA